MTLQFLIGLQLLPPHSKQPISANIKTLPRCKTCTSELRLPHPHRYQEARWNDPNKAHFNIVHFLKPRAQLPNAPQTKYFDG